MVLSLPHPADQSRIFVFLEDRRDWVDLAGYLHD